MKKCREADDSILFIDASKEFEIIKTLEESMTKKSMEGVAPVANCDIQSTRIESMIRLIRGQQVIIDRDLAVLYNVETRRLNEQVKRNAGRFPEDFMFQLSKEEFEDWKSQFATSNSVVMGALPVPSDPPANRTNVRDPEGNVSAGRRESKGMCFIVIQPFF